MLCRQMQKRLTIQERESMYTVHQVGSLAVLQEETAAGGSSPLDRDQGPGARQGERVPRRQADRAPGAREGPEGDVWTQLRAAAVHPEIAQ